MDWDDAYANAAHIPGAADYPPRWAAVASEYRNAAQAEGRAALDLRYGEAEREVYDLFLPTDHAKGLMVFVHGGYWRAFDKSSWSHLAQGAIARGWSVAMPSYTLAPQARIAQITRQIAQAITAVAGKVDGPIVLSGHSAGGHLVARMLCADIGLAVGDRIRRVVPISPLADLRPLLKTAMNSDLQLDTAEAAAESPILHPAPSVDVHTWVGAEERPVFLDQARWLKDAWKTELTVAEGRHHFDVIAELAEADAPLTNAILKP